MLKKLVEHFYSLKVEYEDIKYRMENVNINRQDIVNNIRKIKNVK